MSHGGTDSAALRTSGATNPGSAPDSSASSTARTRPSWIARSTSSRSRPCSVRERVEGVLVAEREHELLARDAELACDPVDRSERDRLDRLGETLRAGPLARVARIGDRRGLEAPAAEREVGHDHGCDQPEHDEKRGESPHVGRLRRKSTGTSAHSVSAAASRNGPEKALVTARSS